MRENAEKYGLAGKLRSFRSLRGDVLGMQDESHIKERMCEEIDMAITSDGAEVIVLGCTMQFGYYQELQKQFKIPVIDPMIAAVKHAEYLLELKQKTGWDISRKNLYLAPPRAEMKAWSLEEDYDLNGLLY